MTTSGSAKLFESKRTRTSSQLWKGSLEIVPVSREKCLRCAGNVIEYAYGQLPLFRSHGHGAVQQTRLMLFQSCDWSFVSDVTEVNPRGYA